MPRLEYFKINEPCILWADDKIDFIKAAERHFVKSGFRFIACGDENEVVDLFKDVKPNGVLLDLNWSDAHRVDFTGFDILKKLRMICKDSFYIACSAYSNHRQYRTRIARARFDKIVDKGDLPYEDEEGMERFFNTLEEMSFISEIKMSKSGLENQICINDFELLSNNTKREISIIVYNKNEEAITEALSDTAWILWGGAKVLDGGSGRLSADELMDMYDKRVELQMQIGHPIFYFVRPHSIEELGENGIHITTDWREVKGEDYYPTLQISINEDARCFPIIGDFDTGAELTHISDEILDTLDFSFSKNRFRGTFWFSERPVHVALGEKTKSYEDFRLVKVAVVKGWKTTGFIDQHPQRVALIGRDFLNHFHDYRFTLRGKVKNTTVIKGEN